MNTYYIKNYGVSGRLMPMISCTMTMYHISLLFYPHILLLMSYLGVQRLWNLVAVFLGTIFGANVLIFLISKCIIAPTILPTLYARWPGQTLSYVFLGFYLMAILGNIILMFSLRKEGSAYVSPWGWFTRSFAVAVCVYGPYALITCLTGEFPFRLQATYYCFLLGSFAAFFGVFYLGRFVLSWFGVSKESAKSGLMFGLRGVLILACSASIGMNLFYMLLNGSLEASWPDDDSHCRASVFKGDSWTFRKKYSRKGDVRKESVQLDFFWEVWKTWQRSYPDKPTTTGEAHTMHFKIP
jgi:hypothetical protein